MSFDLKDFNNLDTKRNEILGIGDYVFDTYDDATDAAIRQIQESIDVKSEEEKTLMASISNYQEENGGRPTSKDFEIYEQVMSGASDQHWLGEQLTVLAEMKVVYLFKCVEISMKSLIKAAYPKVNTKGVYQWDAMVNQFKILDVDIPKIDGYQEATDLKKINNCIKHSGEITDEAKKVAEFAAETELNYDNLTAFHKRVKPRVVRFIDGLRQAIVSERYSFDAARLELIATDLLERMDRKTAEAYVGIINKKVGH